MRLERNIPGQIEVVLSKRNVLSLLHKVDEDWSHRTIVKLERDGDRFTDLIIRVEADEDHYNHETRAVPGLAGDMHPETEKFIEAGGICNATDPLGHCTLSYGHPGDCQMVKDLDERDV